MINSSNFSNLQDQNAKKKKKVNPFFALAFILVLALLLIAIMYFMLDILSAVNSEVLQQQATGILMM